MRVTASHLLLMALLTVGPQQPAASANDEPTSGAPPEVKAQEHLQIRDSFSMADLERFKPEPGCETDAEHGVIVCSVVGPSDEMYLIFEGGVAKVMIEVGDRAFQLSEFSGLTAESSAKDVEQWAKGRGFKTFSATPQGRKRSVLALSFPSRWCAKDCYAAFLFVPSGQLESVEIVTNVPYF